MLKFSDQEGGNQQDNQDLVNALRKYQPRTGNKRLQFKSTMLPDSQLKHDAFEKFDQ